MNRWCADPSTAMIAMHRSNERHEVSASTKGPAGHALHLLRLTLSAPEGELVGGYSIVVNASYE